jgi:hypothetical protein
MAAAPYSPLAAQASSFIESYWDKTSGSADRVLPYLRSVYARLIDYYGTKQSRASVLQDKSSFIRRWPIRQTQPLAGVGNPGISCSDATAACEITGLRAFQAVSPDRGAHSAGIVRYSYTVRFPDGRPQIVAEASEVVKSAGFARAEAPPADQSASDLSQ